MAKSPPIIERDDVIVKGASHKLEEVAIVKAIIDVQNIGNVNVGTLTLSDIPLIAYDEEGNKLDVEIVPAKTKNNLLRKIDLIRNLYFASF